MDDKNMNQISTLAQVDPVFRQVVEKLFPAADPRELWDLSKAMPDQSAVHVSSGDKKRKALAGGLLFGTAAEGAAVYRAGQSAFKKKPPMIGPRAPGLKGSLKALKSAHGGKAEFALQATNAAVGLGAARELFKKPKKQTIPKRLSDEDAKRLFDPIIEARRNGSITTEQALDMVERVEKGIIFDLKATKTALRFPEGGTALKIANRGARGEKLHEETNHAIHAGRVGVGTVAATTVGAAGYHKGKTKARAEAVQRPVVKNEDEAEYLFTGEISKTDEDRRQVFGWCSLSMMDGKPVVDLQNDYISPEEIEKAAYDYVLKSRKGGDMHARIGQEPVHKSDMIESMIVTPDKLRQMGIPEEAISKVHTGWWVGFKVNDDDLWSKVKGGERTGFSIHGTGARISKDLEE
jgi:hypothetical protein